MAEIEIPFFLRRWVNARWGSRPIGSATTNCRGEQNRKWNSIMILAKTIFFLFLDAVNNGWARASSGFGYGGGTLRGKRCTQTHQKKMDIHGYDGGAIEWVKLNSENSNFIWPKSYMFIMTAEATMPWLVSTTKVERRPTRLKKLANSKFALGVFFQLPRWLKIACNALATVGNYFIWLSYNRVVVITSSDTKSLVVQRSSAQ